ncbi:DUF1654 domain-containing protein [Halomonas sp. AOP12-C2-37]|uniref:DUF1654 domain-containing protein n=1 Tax=unclassified Halomonas TaxID=2609666 RepID=UPI0040338308
MSKSYEQLVQRVQRKINSPRAQSEHKAKLQRQPEEEADDRERMLADLDTIENVTLTPINDDPNNVLIAWNPEESMS